MLVRCSSLLLRVRFRTRRNAHRKRTKSSEIMADKHVVAVQCRIPVTVNVSLRERRTRDRATGLRLHERDAQPA